MENVLGYVLNKQAKKELFPFYTKAALAERWGLNERRIVDNWSRRHSDFPKPVEGLIKGVGSVYPLYEIIRYEQARGLQVNE